MPAKNIISNLFSTLYNNEMRRKKECIIAPTSNLARDVLRILQKNGYIGEFEHIDDGRGGKFRVQLLGKIVKCNVISPRYSVRKDEYDLWERKYLPSFNYGFLIVSTPLGVMTQMDAKKLGVGGKLLGYVY
ncbi:MAG: 30S ribosomal protein S8 [Nitrososphaeria archaeon]